MEAATETGFAKSSIIATRKDSLSENASSTSSKSSLVSEKLAKIQEMKLKAKEMKLQLEETEKRRASVDRIHALETQLSELHNEKIKRLKHIGIVDDEEELFDPILHTKSSSSSQAKTEKENDIDQVKRFCRQIKSSEKFVTSDDCFENDCSCNVSNSIIDRIRGGAGCGCGIKRQPPNVLYPNLQAARKSVGAIKMENDIVRKFRVQQTGGPQTRQNRQNGPNGQNGNGQPSGSRQLTGLSPRELQVLANQLVEQIDRVRKDNALNRQKITELCVVLKQKEAAIKECTEILCFIVNDKEDVTGVVADVQEEQLAKHVEYLRWILIRLQFENMSQKSEIDQLCNENKSKDGTLKQCKVAKEQAYARKARKEENLLQFTMSNNCALDLPSRLPAEANGIQNEKHVIC